MAITSNFPAIRPSLNLDFANTEVLDPRITFTRASTAAYYDGKTVAKAEENLILQSQAFSTNWESLGSGTTFTASNATAPDGTTTAATIVATQAGSGRRYYTTLRNGVEHTISIYVKWVSGATGFTADLQNAQTSPALTITSSWQRFVWTVTPSADRIWIDFQTDGAGEFQIWGAQLEQRSSVTAYTPTTTAPIINYIPVLQTAAANVARFDHNPLTGESLGLLIEEQRTNLLAYSEDFSNAAWVKNSCTVSANILTAPDGTITADKLVEDSTNTLHFLSYVATFVASTTYTLSVFAKAGERTRLQISGSGSSWASFSTAVFDLSTGTVVTNTGAFTSASITLVGNGWYRCTATGLSNASPISQQVAQFMLVQSGSTTSYTGNGFSGIYIWGAQLEAGASATSYIPTVAAQVTRNRDTAFLPVTGWFAGSGEGTVFAEIDAMNSAAGISTNTAYFGLFGSASLTNGDDRGLTLYASYNFLSRNPTSTSPGLGWQAGISKVAIAMDAAGKYGVKNGGSVLTTSGSGLNNIVGATHFSLAGAASSAACQAVRKISYYPARLTNAQLQAITTP